MNTLLPPFSQNTAEVSISTLVEIGTAVKKAQRLLGQDIPWEPQRQLAKIWQKRINQLETEVVKLNTIREPVLVVAVTGGVKSGKTHIANLILGQQILPESLRHETSRAWTVVPQNITRDDVLELLGPVNPEWLQITEANTRIQERHLILIDLPDFDSESRVAAFQENQQIVERIIPATDVIIFVSSQAHNLTRKSFEWLNQFQKAHGFVFVYNEVSGGEESDAEKRMIQLQRQVEKAGFASQATVLGCAYAPGDYSDTKIVDYLAKLPSNRTLRSWRVSETIHQFVSDIKEIYQENEPKIQAAANNIEKQIAEPFQNQFEADIKAQIESMYGTFQREMLFRIAPKIGGVLGGFIALRRMLSYWSIPGLWLGSRLMGSTGAIVATGSLVFGSLFRRFEAWRDRRQLKMKPLSSDLTRRKTSDLKEQGMSINLELEQALIDPISENEFAEKTIDKDTFNQKLSQMVESAIDNEITPNSPKSGVRSAGRLGSWFWRIVWNLVPSAFLIYAFVSIILSFLNQIPFIPSEWQFNTAPIGFAYYVNTIAILAGICYMEYLFLLAILKKAAKRVGTQIFLKFSHQEHPYLSAIKNRLKAPQNMYAQALRLETDLERLRQILRKAIKGVEITNS